MATREKKFILEFEMQKQYSFYVGICRIGIAPHPQKNKFPDLYSVYIMEYRSTTWSKEYYYDRKQRCFFSPYKMRYIELTGESKQALYIREKLIAFFAQLDKIKEQEEREAQEEKEREYREESRRILEKEIREKFHDRCTYALCFLMSAHSKLRDAVRGKTLAEAEKILRSSPEEFIRFGCERIGGEFSNWETENLESLIHKFLDLAIAWNLITPEVSEPTPAEHQPAHAPQTQQTQSAQEWAKKHVCVTVINADGTISAEKSKAAKSAIIERISSQSSAPQTPAVQEVSEPETQTTSKPKASAPAEAKPARDIPTPKNRNCVYDFSKCKDADTLRKIFTGASLDTVKAIAESYREFQQPADGKKQNKKFYVEAIIRLYFPDYQPAPVQEVKTTVNYPQFIPGKIYVKGCYKNVAANFGADIVIKIIRRKGDFVTVQEVSNPDFAPIFKPIQRKVNLCCLPDGEYIRLSEDKYDIIYSYYEYNFVSRHLFTPGYDIEFDETAYSPDVQDISVNVDDIPADHEPDIAPVSEPETPANNQPAPEPKRETETPQLENFYGARCLHDIQAEHFNMGMVKKCDTPEKLDALLRTGNKSTLWFIGSRLGAISKDNHSTTYRNSHNEEFFIRLCVVHVFPEYKYTPAPKASTRKTASKPTTRKPRHVKKIDSDRQLLIPFDDVDTPATVQPAKPKSRRVSRPRIKRDYSRQLLIDFEEDILDSKTNQTKAA